MGKPKLNTNQAILDQYNQNKSRYGNLENTLLNLFNTERNRNDSSRTDLTNRYGNLADTGGWDPNDLSGVRGDIAGLNELGRTGGLDATAINRFRGGGVYDEFAKTGGYSEGDISNIRSRSNSVIPSMYAGLKDELQRQNTAQGGYSPGYTYGLAKSGRDAYRAGAGQALDTEIGIKDKVNSGRQWGASGMTSSENALQTLRTGNMFRGLEGAGNLGIGLTNSINSGKNIGLGGLEHLRTTPGSEMAYLSELLRTYGMDDSSIAQLISLQKQGGFNWGSLLGLIKYAKYIPINSKGKGKGGPKDRPANVPDYSPDNPQNLDPWMG